MLESQRGEGRGGVKKSRVAFESRKDLYFGLSKERPMRHCM